ADHTASGLNHAGKRIVYFGIGSAAGSVTTEAVNGIPSLSACNQDGAVRKERCGVPISGLHHTPDSRKLPSCGIVQFGVRDVTRLEYLAARKQNLSVCEQSRRASDS